MNSRYRLERAGDRLLRRVVLARLRSLTFILGLSIFSVTKILELPVMIADVHLALFSRCQAMGRPCLLCAVDHPLQRTMQTGNRVGRFTGILETSRAGTCDTRDWPCRSSECLSYMVLLKLTSWTLMPYIGHQQTASN